MADGENQQPSTTVIETSKELTQPIIDHTEKIAHIEEQQKQQEEKLYTQLAQLEDRLSRATGENYTAISERIARIEEKIEALATKSEEEIEEPVDEGVEMTVPDVETSPKPPEKQKRGVRARRKQKRETRKK